MGNAGQWTMDIFTLGQTAQARKAAGQQEAMLRNMQEQQAQQMAEAKRIGPAPTQDLPGQEESEAKRQKRLRALQAGLNTTIKTSSTGLSDGSSTSTPKLKSTLGG